MVRFLLFLLTASALFAQSPSVDGSAFSAGQGIEGEVTALAIQQDGKIIVGGRFSAVNGVPRGNIARLNADGTLDRSFADSIEAGVNGQVFALAVQPDGGVVAGGTFSQAGGGEIMNVVRYNPDGSIDQNFGGPTRALGANGSVLAIAVQPDGKIVIGGNFSSVLGKLRRSVALLNADGTLSDGPIASTVLGSVMALASAKGTVVGGGSFELNGQQARSLFHYQAP